MIVKKKKTSISDRQLIRQHPGDAGLDIVSAEDFSIPPNGSHIVSTGLYVSIPHGYCGIVTGRSGIWYGRGIFVPIGVIDSGYRGEIRVKMVSVTQNQFEYKFSVGDRIAQMLVIPVWAGDVTEVDELDDTDRSVNGFGSTGL
jgi:dUTP pyrophosphatase